MYDDKEKSNDKKLEDYAKDQAWNEFYENGGPELYRNYVQIKEDIEEVNEEIKKGNENDI